MIETMVGGIFVNLYSNYLVKMEWFIPMKENQPTDSEDCKDIFSNKPYD